MPALFIGGIMKIRNLFLDILVSLYDFSAFMIALFLFIISGGGKRDY